MVELRDLPGQDVALRLAMALDFQQHTKSNGVEDARKPYHDGLAFVLDYVT